MLSWLKKITDPTEKLIKNHKKTVEKINLEEVKLQSLSDIEIKEKTTTFKERLRKGESTKDILVEAFAVVKNACRRMAEKQVKFEVNEKEEIWKIVPYDVQILGGILLHEGKVAEMKTGEGKTLVAAFPAYLEALSEKGVHVITVNDYLAKRDSSWMKPLYEFLGLSVGTIVAGQSQAERKNAYNEDISYGTNNEFGFDYLRDNMAKKKEDLVQRDLHFAIVDEVDSILIDEARTPLIISAPANESTNKYSKYSKLVKTLKKDQHFNVDEKRKTAVLTEEGVKEMEKKMGVDNIYTDMGFSEVHHIESALKAEFVFKKDTDYIVKENEVIIVDEFTGRLMPGRRFSDGLHQSLEAKENVTIKRESKTLATITFQNYFRLYKKLSGMTGTAKTEEEEFIKIYGLEVCVVPTNKKIQRIDKPDKVFKNERGKFKAITNLVKERNKTGQPILIGTVSIERSELLSQYLKREKVDHSILNAKNHKLEAQIISHAGKKGAVTIATNMAGRGTDIKLEENVQDLGGLCVIASERHESRRIDNQLRGRSGRQGDKGETQFFVSLEDSLMRLFGSAKLQKLMDTLRIADDMPIESRFVSGAIESAQKKVEGHHFDVRKHVVQYDDVMNKQREIIYKRRKKILSNEDIHNDIKEWIKEEIKNSLDIYIKNREVHKRDVDSFCKYIRSIENDFNSDKKLKNTETEEEFYKITYEFLEKKLENRMIEVDNDSVFKDAEKYIVLNIIDNFWMEHINEMTKLRDQIAFVSYAQKNPLHEYQAEGYKKFVDLLKKIQFHSLKTIFQVKITTSAKVVKSEEKKIDTNIDKIVENLTADDMVKMAGPHRVNPSKKEDDNIDTELSKGKKVRIVAEKEEVVKKSIGRNEPCPCGSNKKYKKCCGV